MTIRTVSSPTRFCTTTKGGSCSPNPTPKCTCEPVIDPPVDGLLYNKAGAIGTSDWTYTPENMTDGARVNAPAYGIQSVTGISAPGPFTVWSHFDYPDDPIVGADDVLCVGTDSVGDQSKTFGGLCVWARHISYLGIGPGVGNAHIGVVEKALEKGGSPPGAYFWPNMLWLSRAPLIDGSDFFTNMFGAGQGVIRAQLATTEPVGNPDAGFVYLWIAADGKLTIRRSDGSTASL